MSQKVATLRSVLAITSFTLVVGALQLGQSYLLLFASAITSMVFFYISILPDSLLGFAITGSQWSKVFRDAFSKEKNWSTKELRSASLRSGCSLSVLILIALSGAMANSYQDSSYIEKSVMLATGLEAGILVGWLIMTFAD